MTRKEKIIEILKSNIHLSFIEDELTGSDHPAMTHKYHSELNGFEQSADAILSLPLDVPMDKEIEGEAMSYSSYPAMPDGHPEFKIIQANDFDAGAKWAIKQIIERNQK